MLKFLATSLSMLFFVMGMNAQVTNLGLESWETSQSGRYEEPTGWATGNSPVDLPSNPPPTNPVEKTTDAVEGNFAAKMETIELLFEVASGSMFLGFFQLDIQNPANSAHFGIPYGDRPYSLTGQYKYNALNGDSCDLYITLFNSNLDASTSRGDTVAHAQIRSDQVVANYTPFELVLDYKSSASVDTIQIVFASSAAGADLMGEIGAALYVDGLTMNMPNGIKHLLMPEVKVNTFPNPAQDYLVMDMDKLVPNGKLAVFAADGRLVKQEKVMETNLKLDIADLPQGTYHYLLTDQGGAGMASGSFVVGK